MIECCQDALAINRFYGGADLFITATANPNWPEITGELFPGQTPSDRCDLVARVFKLKMDSLLHEIDNGLLGVCVGRVHTIEFQKRGLPHMHLIVFLATQSKLRTPEDIDSLISAEVPENDDVLQCYDYISNYII